MSRLLQRTNYCKRQSYFCLDEVYTDYFVHVTSLKPDSVAIVALYTQQHTVIARFSPVTPYILVLTGETELRARKT